MALSSSEYLVMVAIGRGHAHGYAIMQEVEGLSRRRFRMGPGTLYRSIQRMVAAKLLEEVEEEDGTTGDERRRYYRLTTLGVSIAGEESSRLQVLLRAAKARGLTPRKWKRL
jgi:DNA-binding PadR family transcriptional regulator